MLQMEGRKLNFLINGNSDNAVFVMLTLTADFNRTLKEM